MDRLNKLSEPKQDAANQNLTLSEDEFCIVENQTPKVRRTKKTNSKNYIPPQASESITSSREGAVAQLSFNSHILSHSFPTLNTNPLDFPQPLRQSCPSRLDCPPIPSLIPDYYTSPSSKQSGCEQYDTTLNPFPSNSGLETSSVVSSVFNDVQFPTIGSQIESSVKQTFHLRKPSFEASQWCNLNDSEYQFDGAQISNVTISDLKLPVDSLSGLITILIIGNCKDSNSIKNVSFKLASSVGCTYKKDKDDDEDDNLEPLNPKPENRPLLRVCDATDLPFSSILLHLSSIQEYRSEGLLLPVIDLCICFVDHKKIMRLDVAMLKEISSCVNLLPILNTSSSESTAVDDTVGELLAERLTLSEVDCYRFYSGPSKSSSGVQNVNADSPIPCMTLSKFIDTPSLLIMFALPGLRTTAQQKLQHHPVVNKKEKHNLIFIVVLIAIILSVLQVCYHLKKLATIDDRFMKDTFYKPDVVFFKTMSDLNQHQEPSHHDPDSYYDDEL